MRPRPRHRHPARSCLSAGRTSISVPKLPRYRHRGPGAGFGLAPAYPPRPLFAPPSTSPPVPFPTGRDTVAAIFTLTFAHITGPLDPASAIAAIRRLGARGLIESMGREEALHLLTTPHVDGIDDDLLDQVLEFDYSVATRGVTALEEGPPRLVQAYEGVLVAAAELWVEEVTRLVHGESAYEHHGPLESFDRVPTREGWLLVGLGHEAMNPSFDEFGVAEDLLAGAEVWPDVSMTLGLVPASRFEISIQPRGATSPSVS